jgi:hypothetical protein
MQTCPIWVGHGYVNSLIASHAGPDGFLRSPPTASTPRFTTLYITLRPLSTRHGCLHEHVKSTGGIIPALCLRRERLHLRTPSSLGEHIKHMDHKLDSDGRPSGSMPLPLPSSTSSSIIAPYPPYPGAMVAPLNARRRSSLQSSSFSSLSDVRCVHFARTSGA